MHKLALLARHKSVGMTILMLAMLRLAVAALASRPAAAAGMTPFERIAARGTHVAFYVLLFAMPLTGWMMSSAKNYSVSWFGLFTWPNLIGKNEAAFDFLRTTHDTLSDVLFAIAVLHILAALKHHFWNRDDVLVRMLPFTESARGDHDENADAMCHRDSGAAAALLAAERRGRLGRELYGGPRDEPAGIHRRAGRRGVQGRFPQVHRRRRFRIRTRWRARTSTCRST